MNSIEDKLLLHVNLDNNCENALISLVSEINSIMSNFPEYNCNALVGNIAQLVNTIDSITVRNNDLMSMNVDLTCEISQLNVYYDNFKRDKQAELNLSFQIHDAVSEENEVLNKNLVSYQNKIASLQTSLKKLKEENDELRMSLLNKVIDNSALCPDTNNTISSALTDKEYIGILSDKLNDALNAKSNLSLELKRNVSSDWTKSKWLDDNIINSFMIACESSV